MDTHLNNFGPRFRRLVEQRGTIESAYQALGISRATLFNWFKRDRLPPGEGMQEKIRQYLGDEAGEVLDLCLKSVGANDSLCEPDQAPYSTPETLRREIEQRHQEVLAQAGDDVARLGWVLIQTQTHLSPPTEWKRGKGKSFVAVSAPAHHQNPVQPASGRSARAASAA